MATSTLAIHNNSKFDSFLTTRDALRNLPEPMPQGPMHRPIAHIKLIDSIVAEAERRDMRVLRDQLALGSKGAVLFGVMDLVAKGAAAGAESTMSLGFRAGNNRQVALKMVAGERVFVCDNLAMSGDTFALKAMHTTGLDLRAALARGFDRFLQHVEGLRLQIGRLKASPLNDFEARALAFEAFAAGVVPSRLLDDVDRFYFRPTEDMTDCQPRSLWGLHNAFTRAMHDLTPIRKYGATIALGQLFGVRTRQQDDEVETDAEAAEAE